MAHLVRLVRLSEGSVVTRCELVTYDPEDILDLGFEDSADIARVIMKSEGLKEAFSALGADASGTAGCDTITFSLDPAPDACWCTLFLTLSCAPQQLMLKLRTARESSAQAKLGMESHGNTGTSNVSGSSSPFNIRARTTYAKPMAQVEFVHDREIIEVFECYTPLCHTSVPLSAPSRSNLLLLIAPFILTATASNTSSTSKRRSTLLPKRSVPTLPPPCRWVKSKGLPRADVEGLWPLFHFVQSIRTDETGLLSLQFMMPMKQAKGAGHGAYGRKDVENGFVEFLVWDPASPL